jgi:hypothetical protein
MTFVRICLHLEVHPLKEKSQIPNPKFQSSNPPPEANPKSQYSAQNTEFGIQKIEFKIRYSGSWILAFITTSPRVAGRSL